MPPKKMIASDRVALLLALVPYLRDHGPTPVVELATTFDVAPELLRRLVRFLGTAGVPGETLSYQHEDLFDIDWAALEDHDIVSLTRTVAVDDTPRFSPAETAALLAGLDALTTVLPAEDAEAARTLAARLAAALEVAEAPLTVTAEPQPPAVPAIVAALREGRALAFDYTDIEGASSSRVVDPFALTQGGGSWYLRGFCRSREAERTFRVEQMAAVRAVERTDRRRAPEPPRSEAASAIVALVPARVRHRIAGFAPEVLASEDGMLRVRIEAWHPQTAVRLVQHAPGEVTIESPPEAREAVRIWAERALAGYGG